jgi:hypothetical protein
MVAGNTRPPFIFKSIGMKKIYATNFGICLVMILAFYVMMVWLPRLV